MAIESVPTSFNESAHHDVNQTTFGTILDAHEASYRTTSNAIFGSVLQNATHTVLSTIFSLNISSFLTPRPSGYRPPPPLHTQPICTGAHEELLCRLVAPQVEFQINYTFIDYTDIDKSRWLWAVFGLFAPLGLFGIIGNLMTIIIYSKYIKIKATSIFIIALGVTDLLVCSVNIPIFLNNLFHEYHGIDFICKLNTFVYCISIPLSGGILLVVAVDRFALIYLGKTKFVTIGRAKVICVIMFVLSLPIPILQAGSFSTWSALSLDHVAYYCNPRDKDISCNTLKCRLNLTYLSPDAWYYLWQSLIIFFAIIVFIFTILYFLIFCKIYGFHKRSEKWKKEQLSPKKPEISQVDHITGSSGKFYCSTEPQEPIRTISKEVSEAVPTQIIAEKSNKRLPHHHTAMVLCVVTFTFLLSYSPLVIMKVMKECVSEVQPNIPNRNICTKNDYRYFLLHFYFLGHIANPIIYTFMSPRVRTVLSKGYRRWLRRHPGCRRPACC